MVFYCYVSVLMSWGVLMVCMWWLLLGISLMKSCRLGGGNWLVVFLGYL